MNNQHSAPFKQLTAYTDETPVVASNSSKINAPKDNIPQSVKIVEAHAEEVWDEYSEYIGEDIHSLDSVAGSSVIPSRYRFLKAASSIYTPLQSRIAELEAQNKELREALEEVVTILNYNGIGDVHSDLKEAFKAMSKIGHVAEQALNPKSNG